MISCIYQLHLVMQEASVHISTYGSPSLFVILLHAVAAQPGQLCSISAATQS